MTPPPAEPTPVHYPACNDQCIHYLVGEYPVLTVAGWGPAAPDPALLDVERLARAFWSVTRERFAASPLVPDLPEWRDPSIDAATWDKSVSDAAEVAREYEAQP